MFFVAPVTSVYGLTELAVKATPLALIAVGLAVGFRANVWNIGAEGQFTMGAIAAGGLALAFWGRRGLVAAAADGAGRDRRWHGLGRDSGPAAHPVQRQRDPGQPDADLCGDPVPRLSRLRALARPGRIQFSGVPPVWPGGAAARPDPRHAAARRRPVRTGRRRGRLAAGRALPDRLRGQGGGPGADGRALRRVLGPAHGLVSRSCCPAASRASPAWRRYRDRSASCSPRSARATASRRSSSPSWAGCTRWGSCWRRCCWRSATWGARAVQIGMGLPLAATGVFQGMLLFFLLASDVLIRYRVRFGRAAPARGASRTPVAAPVREAGE